MERERRTRKPPLPVSDWEETWEKYWQKAGQKSDEAPVDESDTTGFERQFLTSNISPEKEMERLKKLNADLENAFRKLNKVGPAVAIFGSSRYPEGHHYYDLARQVGRAVAGAGFAVFTNGCQGLNEAVNRGAFEASAKSYGLHIMTKDQKPNPFINELIPFTSYLARKVVMLKYSNALIILPGGLGTMDYLYEAATLIQCGKLGPYPIILMDKKFWKNVAMLTRNQATRGAIAHEELGFGRRLDRPRDAVDLILKSVPASVRQYLNR